MQYIDKVDVSPVALQRQVPPATINQATKHVEILQQYIDKVALLPVVMQRQATIIVDTSCRKRLRDLGMTPGRRLTRNCASTRAEHRQPAPVKGQTRASTLPCTSCRLLEPDSRRMPVAHASAPRKIVVLEGLPRDTKTSWIEAHPKCESLTDDALSEDSLPLLNCGRAKPVGTKEEDAVYEDPMLWRTMTSQLPPKNQGCEKSSSAYDRWLAAGDRDWAREADGKEIRRRA